MYHDNPKINDIILTVINDGAGDQCRFTYGQRCALARAKGRAIYVFRQMARNYSHYAYKHYGTKPASLKETTEAGNYLFDYYCEHVEEL